MKIALLESLPEKFIQKSKTLNYNVYDLTSFFKSYKTIYNYKNLSHNEKLQILSYIKKEVQKEFENKDFFKNIDVVIFRTKLIIDKELIDLFGSAKLFIRSGSGFENIDFRYCFKKNILFQNIPEANEISAAEHTISLILASLKKIIYFDNSIRLGKWRNNYPFNIELNGKNVLLIGYGRVGKRVASILSILGANIYVFDPYYDKTLENSIENNNSNNNHTNNGISNNKEKSNTDFYVNNNKNIHFLKYKNIKEIDFNLKSRIDLISLHVPLWDETDKMIDKEFLKGFNKNLFIINTARGEVVNLDDIYDLLKNNKLGFYSSDVFPEEPLFKDRIFTLKEKTLFTPHIGAYTNEAKEKLVDLTIEALKHFEKTGKCKYNIDRRFYYSKYYRDQ